MAHVELAHLIKLSSYHLTENSGTGCRLYKRRCEAFAVRNAFFLPWRDRHLLTSVSRTRLPAVW